MKRRPQNISYKKSENVISTELSDSEVPLWSRKLLFLRYKKNLSQAELYKLTGVAQNTQSFIESGEFRIKAVFKILSYYVENGLDIYWFFDDNEIFIDSKIPFAEKNINRKVSRLFRKVVEMM